MIEYPKPPLLSRLAEPTDRRWNYLEDLEPNHIEMDVEVEVTYWHDTGRPTTTFQYPPCFYSLPYAADYYEGLSDAFKRLCGKNRKN